MFFLNGHGETGKMFVYNTICAKLCSEGKIILCVSSSGISALLIHGGQTAYSIFKIPIDGLTKGLMCNISKHSSHADLLHSTVAIIWHEIGAQLWHAVEAVDCTLCDICSDDQPFAGITTILGGDFLQTLPVVLKGSCEDIIDATIHQSDLLQNVEILFLHQNMCIDQGSADAHQCSQWLLEIGHGRNVTDDGQVCVPEHMRVNSVESLIGSIYPTINSNSPPPPEYFLNCMILALRNADVSDLNLQILDRMFGDVQQYISADDMICEAGADTEDDEPIPVKFLQSINFSSLPPGELLRLDSLLSFFTTCHHPRVSVMELT